MYKRIIPTTETFTTTHTTLLQQLLDTPGTSARQRVQQQMVRCQRDARLKRLAKGGMSMLLTHAMLSEHRNAPRDTPYQLESFCADAPLERITSLSLVSSLNRGPVGA